VGEVAGLMLSFVGARARASGDPKTIADFARTLAYVGPRVFVPALLAVLVFGVWMVLISAEWNFSQAWVLLALGLFVVAFLIGALYLGRIGIQFERAAESGGAGDGRLLLDRWIVAYRVVLLVLVVAVWDMIFKPGL
jgi:uncharacterized membrane protein